MTDRYYLRGAYSTCSKKDLNACAPIVFKKLGSKGLEDTITHFQKCLKDQVYIPYKKHVSGLSHHCGLGPSRRPLKCYKHVIEFLKGVRGAFKYLEQNRRELKIRHVLINTSTKRLPKGVRKGSRGRRHPEDSTMHRVVLVFS